jgi:hypothetical protein
MLDSDLLDLDNVSLQLARKPVPMAIVLFRPVVRTSFWLVVVLSALIGIIAMSITMLLLIALLWQRPVYLIGLGAILISVLTVQLYRHFDQLLWVVQAVLESRLYGNWSKSLWEIYLPALIGAVAALVIRYIY